MEYDLFKTELMNKLNHRLNTELHGSFTCYYENGYRVNVGDTEYLLIADRDAFNDIATRIAVPDLYDGFNKGYTFDEIVDAVINARAESSRTKDEYGETYKLFDPDFIRENSYIGVMSATTNRKILDQIAYQKVEGYDDLISIIRIDVSSFRCIEGTGSVIMFNELMDSVGISRTELFEVAKQNSQTRNPLQILSTQEAYDEYYHSLGLETPVKLGAKMFIVGDTSGVRSENGAAVLTYDGFKEKLASTVGENCYIMPASVHELIVMPESQISRPDRISLLLNHTYMINRIVLAPNERLSDNIYKFDISKMSVQTITAEQSRTSEREL